MIRFFAGRDKWSVYRPSLSRQRPPPWALLGLDFIQVGGHQYTGQLRHRVCLILVEFRVPAIDSRLRGPVIAEESAESEAGQVEASLAVPEPSLANAPPHLLDTAVGDRPPAPETLQWPWPRDEEMLLGL